MSLCLRVISFRELGIMSVLSGKTAIVTGASAPNGIGRAIALRLAQDGANLVVADIDGVLAIDGENQSRIDLLENLASTISSGQGKAIAIKLDVTIQSDVNNCIAATLAAFDTVDVLVNNAGSLAGSDNFLSTTPIQWETSFQVNILGPMMMAKAVIPIMQKSGGGRIINIGSTGSLGAEPGFGAYTAMKHGLVGLTKTIAAEFGVNGILCNTVCPGYISTDMHMAANKRLASEHGMTIEDVKSKRYESVALRDAGLPMDVANAVAYLAGPQANYVTGINLPVTGGAPAGI